MASNVASPKEDPATQKLIERLKFQGRRPEYCGLIGALLATVSSCGSFGKVIPNFTLEEAHTHMQGSNGLSSCDFCLRNFAEKKRNHEKIYSQGAKS